MTQKVQELVTAIKTTEDLDLRCNLYNDFIESNKDDIELIRSVHGQVGTLVLESAVALRNSPEYKAKEAIKRAAWKQGFEEGKIKAQPLIEAWHALPTVSEKLTAWRNFLRYEDQVNYGNESSEGQFVDMHFRVEVKEHAHALYDTPEGQDFMKQLDEKFRAGK